MSSHLLQVAQLCQLMLRVDEEVAEGVRRQGCPHCAATLHCADFPRKPRGCPKRFVEAYSSRASYTCYGCKQRTTPPSVRFQGRHVYLAVVLALVGYRDSPQVSWLSRVLKVPMRTMDRWRAWWRQDFVETPLWQALRGQFVPPPDTQTLPGSLLERVQALDQTQRLLRFLNLIAPLSTASRLCASK